MLARAAGESRRDQLLQCAKTVFAEHGYHAASIADIIACAGVARGTFYLYFDGKRQLFDRLLDDLLQGIDARIRVIDLGPDAAPPVEQLRANLHRVLTLLLQDRSLVRILLHEAVALDADGRAKLEAFYRKLLDHIETSLRLGIELGLVRPCDPPIAAACILGAVKEAIAQLVERPQADDEIERVIDQILAFGLHGVLEPARA
jgi:AcrR family transcriptional regulator